MQRTSSKTQILAIKTQLSLGPAHLSKNYGGITGSVYPATPPSPPLFQGELSPGSIACCHAQRLPGDHPLLFEILTQTFLNYKSCCSLGPSWVSIIPFIIFSI